MRRLSRSARWGCALHKSDPVSKTRTTNYRRARGRLSERAFIRGREREEIAGALYIQEREREDCYLHVSFIDYLFVPRRVAYVICANPPPLLLRPLKTRLEVIAARAFSLSLCKQSRQNLRLQREFALPTFFFFKYLIYPHSSPLYNRAH